MNSYLPRQRAYVKKVWEGKDSNFSFEYTEVEHNSGMLKIVRYFAD